jgi:hypothetical protein
MEELEETLQTPHGLLLFLRFSPEGRMIPLWCDIKLNFYTVDNIPVGIAPESPRAWPPGRPNMPLDSYVQASFVHCV